MNRWSTESQLLLEKQLSYLVNQGIMDTQHIVYSPPQSSHSIANSVSTELGDTPTVPC